MQEAGKKSAHSPDGTPFDRFARFYEQDYRDYVDDLELVQGLAHEQGGPVLEAGCGTGRVLLPLAQNGYAVTGVDISRKLLSIARRKATANGLADSATLLQADMRTTMLPQGDFSFAYCVSNTFMHVSSAEGQLDTLENFHRHLRAGGLLLLDLFNPDPARLLAVDGLQELADRWRDEATGADVLKWSVRGVDWATQIQETVFIYEEVFPDGAIRRTVCPFTLRFLWRSEAELMLRLAGFHVEAVMGDFDGEPHHQHSDRLILLARKAK